MFSNPEIFITFEGFCLRKPKQNSFDSVFSSPDFFLISATEHSSKRFYGCCFRETSVPDVMEGRRQHLTVWGLGNLLFGVAFRV